MVKRRLEYRDGNEEKFCDIAIEGSGVTVVEGAIGSGEPSSPTSPEGAGKPRRSQTTTTHRFDSEDEAAEAASEMIDERRQSGWVVPFEPDPEIARYFAEDFVAEVVGESPERDQPLDHLETLERLHNTRFAPELRAFLEMKDRYQLGYNDLGEWRIWGDDAWVPDPDAGNLFEQVVLLDQRNYLGTAMLEYGASMVYLGSAGNGDCYFAALDFRHPENTAVAFWDHETQDLTHFIADSLGTLGYANHLLERVQSSDDLDTEALIEDTERIADRCALSWHYRSLCEAAEVDPELACDAPTRYYFYRALPLAYLLNNNHKLHVVENLWGILPHEQIDFEQTINGPFLATAPPTAFYWLWRLFFFDADEKLRRAIAVCADSPSPIIRDMAALVEELQDGRETLGSIEDIHELRRRFIELDLDPDRAAERAREEAEAKRAAEEQAEADRARVAEWTATRTPDDLIDLAWKHCGNEVLIDGLYAHLATAGDAALTAALRRWQFIDSGGASRDNKYFSEENDETWEALGATAPASILPLLITRGGHTGLPIAAEIAARTGDVREPLLESIREHIDAREEYCHRNTAGIQAAVALGDHPDLAIDFDALFDRFAYDPTDIIEGIGKKDINVALVRALGALKVDGAAGRLAAIATGDNPKLVAPAISALGVLGDPASVETITGFLETDHQRVALYALARIGDPAARPAVDALVSTMAGLPELLAYPRLMATALAPRPDLDVVRLALEVVAHDHYDQIEQLEIAIELLDRHASDAEVVERLAGFVDAEHHRVRRAALAAMARHGRSITGRYLDRGTVDALYDEGGAAALVEALDDPSAVYRHNLVRKAVDEEVTAEIAEAADRYVRQAARFETYTYQFVRSDSEWKRTNYGLAAAARCAPEIAHWLLTHPNVMVREVFRYHSDEIKDAAAAVGPMDVRAPASRAPAHPRGFETATVGDQRWALGAMINGMAYTPDGKALAVVGAGGGKLIDAATGEVIRELEAIAGRWVYDVDIHPGGELAAAGTNNARLHFFKLSDGKPTATLHGHGGGVRKVRFSPGGGRVATAGDDQRLVFWKVGEPEPVSRISEPFDVNGVDWLDEDTVVFATDKHVGIARFGAESAETRVDLAGAEVRAFAGGTRIAAGGSSEKSITIFDRELAEIAHHRQANVARIRLSADESVMFAASWSGDDTGVSRIDLATGERTPIGHAETDAFGMALCPVTGVVAAGGKLNRVVRFAPDGAPLDASGAGHTSSVDAIAAAGDRLFTGGGSELIAWPRGGGEPAAFDAPGINAVAIVGSTAYVAGKGGRAIDLETGEVRWTVELQRSEIAAATEAGAVVFGSRGELVWVDRETGAIEASETVSSDTWLEHLVDLGGGRAAVAGYREHHFEIWDLDRRERIARVELPASADKPDTCHYTYSAATGCVYVSRWDRSIVEIDAGTGEVRRTIQLNCPHYPIAASPAAPVLMLSRGNRAVALDLSSGELAGDVEVSGAGIESMAFVGDRELCCGASGGEITIVTIGE